MRKLIFLLAICLSPLARAEQIHPLLWKHDICGFYSVVHINGVDTSIDGARTNLNAIATAYGNAHNGYKVRYGLAYNQTRGLIMDVIKPINRSCSGFQG